MTAPTAPHQPVVVVTRAADQAGGLAARLLAAGYAVVEVPVIEIVDPVDGGVALAAALRDLACFDWLVVTSPNGAARVAGAVVALDPADRPRLATIGPGTADALGLPVDLIASASIGEGLVDAFAVGTGRVLLAHAEAARPVVAEGLAAKGWQVTAVVAYRTVAARPPEALVDAAASADAIVFTSGSTVRHFVAVAGLDHVPPVVVSIGPVTSAVAEEQGVRVTVTADDHSLDGAVAALIRVVPPSGRFSTGAPSSLD